MKEIKMEEGNLYELADDKAIHYPSIQTWWSYYCGFSSTTKAYGAFIIVNKKRYWLWKMRPHFGNRDRIKEAEKWFYEKIDKEKKQLIEKLKTISKPPLGAMPKKIWIEDRVLELTRAIKDQFEYQYDYMGTNTKEKISEWLEELEQLTTIY